MTVVMKLCDSARWVYTGGMGGFEQLPVIRKHSADLPAEPNLRDYASTCSTFTWDEAERWLDGLPGGGMNIAYEAVDRHVVHGRGDHVALRCLNKQGGQVDVTYAALASQTNTFANALRPWGSAPVSGSSASSGRVPALYVAVLGTLKARTVFAPLFSAFGPEPIRQRVVIGGGVAMLTTKALYRKKIAVVRDEMPTLRHVILADEPDDEDVTDIPGAIYFDKLMAGQSQDFAIEATDPEDTSLLHFTSGTTGTPEGRGPRARRGGRALRDRALRAGSAPRGRVLVHSRSGLGDGHLLRHHLAADARPDDDRGRGRVRRPPLVRDSERAARQRLVHRPHRDPHADARRRRASRRTTTCRRCGSWPVSANRSTPRPSCGDARPWA